MRKLLTGALVLAVLVPTGAFADSVRVGFSGVIHTANVFTTDPSAGAINVGDRFYGTYEYDGDALPAGGPPLPGQDQASYYSDGMPYGLSVMIDGAFGTSIGPFSRLNYRVVAEQPPRDALDIQTTNFVMSGSPAYLAQIFLADTTETAVNDLDLPQAAPNPGDFDIRDFFLGFGTSGSPDAVFVGTIDSLETLAPPTTVNTEAGFLSLVGNVHREGFESLPTDPNCVGGIPSVITPLLSVTSSPLDGGQAWLCVGTTAAGFPGPTEGNNAIVAGSDTGDRWTLSFVLPEPATGVYFELTDAVERGDAFISIEGVGIVQVASKGQGGLNTVRFGIVTEEPFIEFQLINTGVFDGWGIDNIILAKASVEVSIDIKPGSFPNSLSPASKGFMPVAVLTTSIVDGDSADFNVLDIDPDTLAFGPAGAPTARPAKYKDVDDDGDDDLILHFKTSETGIRCGDTEATLTGQLFSGESIIGSDTIRTVKCPRAPIPTITVLIGDKDCFGLGGVCTDGDRYVEDLGGIHFADNRDPGEPLGVDNWGTNVMLGGPSFDFGLDLGGATPSSASFTIFLAGLEHGTTFFLNGSDIGYYVGIPIGEVNPAITLTFDVPISLLSTTNTLTMDVPDVGHVQDGFIVDYLELTVEAAAATP